MIVIIVVILVLDLGDAQCDGCRQVLLMFDMGCALSSSQHNNKASGNSAGRNIRINSKSSICRSSINKHHVNSILF